MIKRFLVFAYDNCYPSGGWHDFIDSYATELEAKDAADLIADRWQNIDIVDTQLNTLERYQG